MYSSDSRFNKAGMIDGNISIVQKDNKRESIKLSVDKGTYRNKNKNSSSSDDSLSSQVTEELHKQYKY